MAKARAAWERRCIPGRRLIFTLVVAAALTPAAMSAQAADQQIFAVVAPTMGVSVSAAGHVTSGGTTPVDITREWHGGTLVVTVTPRWN